MSDAQNRMEDRPQDLEIVSSANFFHLALDPEFRILDVNSWLRNSFTGLKKDLGGENFFRYFDVDPKVESEIIDQLTGHAQLQNITFLISFGDQQVYGIWNIKKIIHDQTGHQFSYHFFGSDVTERRKLQLQLAQSEKLSAMGRMAAGIAHDISKPTNAIISLVQVLEDYTEDSFILEKLGLMTTQMEYLNNKVRQLVDLGRPMQPNIEAVDINKVMMEAIRIINYDSNLKQVRIETYLCPAMQLIQLSFDHVLQVFINILLNAGDAVKDEAEPIIVISTECRDGKIFIDIQDNGCGISPEVLPHIFDPFFTRKKGKNGTGLGLWMCHTIITAIKGRIWIDSSEGKGSSVHLVLPLAQEEAVNAE